MTNEQFGLFGIDLKGMERGGAICLVVSVGSFKFHKVIGPKIVYYKQKMSLQSGHIRLFE